MGVFQVEGQGMRRVLMELRPTEFDHITATISLYRPGPMEFIPAFISVPARRTETRVCASCPGTDPVRDDGVCVYQEQVIQILADIAGYTPVRRTWFAAASARSPRDSGRAPGDFRAGECKKVGAEAEEADAIWDALMGFARYGFNRAHAADYAVVVAQTGI